MQASGVSYKSAGKWCELQECRQVVCVTRVQAGGVSYKSAGKWYTKLEHEKIKHVHMPSTRHKLTCSFSREHSIKLEVTHA